MDTVIKKISNIEAAASSVMDDANARKKAFAKEIENKTIAFDQALELDTEKKLEKLRQEKEGEMDAQLTKQKAAAEAILSQMERNYQENHTQYARKLFQQLIKE